MEILFAGHCTPMAHSDYELQAIVSRFAKAFYLFGLTISLCKTEGMNQPAPWSAVTPPNTNIDDTQLKSVDHFKYLGSIIFSYGSLDKNTEALIGKASQLLGHLCSQVMNNGNIMLTSKTKVY